LVCLSSDEKLNPSLNRRLSIYAAPIRLISLCQLWHGFMQCCLHFGLFVLVYRVSLIARTTVSFRETRINTAFTRGEMWFWEGFSLCIPALYHHYFLSRPNLNQPCINCVSCFYKLICVV